MKKIFIGLLLISSTPLVFSSNLKSLSDRDSIDSLKELNFEILKSANWYTTATSDTGVTFLNANEVSVDKEKSVVTALVRSAPRRDLENGMLLTYTDYLERHDCKNNTVKVLSFAEYKDNELVKSASWDFPAESISKDTVGEQKHIDACEYLELVK